MDNNIYAFPVFAQDDTGHVAFQSGLTALDYFAGQAMQGMMACPNYTPELIQGVDYEEVARQDASLFETVLKTTLQDRYAREAFMLAAAMLEARKRFIP